MVNRTDLQPLTLVGPTWDNPVLDPLATPFAADYQYKVFTTLFENENNWRVTYSSQDVIPFLS